ncbi:MAG TPA: cytochrome c biogenesis protein CcdA [Dehalococcoidia bacterium]|nr:cytochrome c biogenesis protein CcdA [Dehalococcoidia bacterium]
MTRSLLNYGRSFGVGSAFAVGWTPCIGPILGAIFTLAASSATVGQGALLLAFWSLGLGLPFLIAGLALGWVMSGIRRLRPVMPALEVAGGALVIVVGVLIFLDRFTIFNQYLGLFSNTVTGAEEGLDGADVAGPLGFAVAFGAGVIAFLSPCCLPLVPAYIAHLAGVTVEGSDFHVDRGRTARHALAFVLGFSTVFVILGASVGAIGYVVRDNLATIEKVAGVLLIVMGLNLMGVIRIPWLYRTYQVDFGSKEPSPTVAPEATT